MKIKKSDLLSMIQEQNDVIAKLIRQVNCHHEDIIRLEGVIEPEPQPKQLDQSIFDGLDEKWRFAMVSSVGIPFVYDYKPTGKRYFLSDSSAQLMVSLGKVMRIDEYDYDTSNWQNSLIERESRELTGSELCKAMLEHGDKYVLCIVSPYRDAIDNGSVILPKVVTKFHEYGFITTDGKWAYAIPINNQGEPLTASEVGL